LQFLEIFTFVLHIYKPANNKSDAVMTLVWSRSSKFVTFTCTIDSSREKWEQLQA
jgi:hypothetical protein